MLGQEIMMRDLRDDGRGGRFLMDVLSLMIKCLSLGREGKG